MKSSKSLEEFVKVFPDFLEDPESYLGPNWSTVLNYWQFLDTLSDLERTEIIYKYDATENKNRFVIFECFKEATGSYNDCDLSRYTYGTLALSMPAYEIIGMHLLLERGIPIVYLKMFDGL